MQGRFVLAAAASRYSGARFKLLRCDRCCCLPPLGPPHTLSTQGCTTAGRILPDPKASERSPRTSCRCPLRGAKYVPRTHCGDFIHPHPLMYSYTLEGFCCGKRSSLYAIVALLLNQALFVAHAFPEKPGGCGGVKKNPNKSSRT